MAAVDSTLPSPTPRWLPAALLAVALGFGAWVTLSLYTSDASRECHARYRAARTAGDSARVDALVPAASRRGSEPHSCGFTRTTARWR